MAKSIKLPRAPLPRQTEKVHSERVKPELPLNQNLNDWKYDEPVEEPWAELDDDLVWYSDVDPGDENDAS